MGCGSVKFSEAYPFVGPQIVFKTKIYHPFINALTGEVKLPPWSSTSRISNVLREIASMLNNVMTSVAAADDDGDDGGDSNPPLLPEIADQIKTNPALYAATAQQWVKKFA